MMGDKGSNFFSEEKKQKTFISLPFPGSSPWPGSMRGRPRNKGLFASFYSEKEDSSFRVSL
jgi:hypothetical protein